MTLGYDDETELLKPFPDEKCDAYKTTLIEENLFAPREENLLRETGLLLGLAALTTFGAGTDLILQGSGKMGLFPFLPGLLFLFSATGIFLQKPWGKWSALVLSGIVSVVSSAAIVGGAFLPNPFADMPPLSASPLFFFLVPISLLFVFLVFIRLVAALWQKRGERNFRIS